MIGGCYLDSKNELCSFYSIYTFIAQYFQANVKRLSLIYYFKFRVINQFLLINNFIHLEK